MSDAACRLPDACGHSVVHSPFQLSTALGNPSSGSGPDVRPLQKAGAIGARGIRGVVCDE